nr:hypothetical protein [Tanacetum cinerariifolium]
ASIPTKRKLDLTTGINFLGAFQVTADVPEIYMQEFWATAKLHHTSIRFKIDTKKSVLNLEAFREMLHVSPRIPNQPFADLPTEEEVIEFLRFLGHSQDIRYLTDVNVNKLYQPWRSFASVINKCLTGKSSGVDSFRLSQAQMLWGLYNRINIDFAYLIWEDFVYQVEHKSQKRRIRRKTYDVDYIVCTNSMWYRIMATTIEQQTALDESLVPSSQRLRIGRCNFRLPSDIQSKEATLQVVYDVLRNSPLFKAFQVTADVPEIYMQEF